jgi:hypothetical protein
MNPSKLDAWITGNHGEDHPNNIEQRSRCEACGELDIVEADMAEQCGGKALCEHCYGVEEIRLCVWCYSPNELDSMWAADVSKRYRARDHFELFCEACGEDLAEDKGISREAFEAEYLDAREAECMRDSRGKSLPERIEQICRAWEWRFLPRGKREEMSSAQRAEYLKAEAGKLCERFADTAPIDLTGFEATILRNATKGDFRK